MNHLRILYYTLRKALAPEQDKPFWDALIELIKD